MKRSVDCIVVGGGLAGLTSAAYLSRGNLSTILVEKREKIGGLVETFWHEGFAFDAGIRAFENSGIILPMLKDLGIQMDYVENQVSIGIGEEIIKLQGKESLDEYVAMLLKLFPEEREAVLAMGEEIKKVMGYMDVLYGIDNPLFMEKMDVTYLQKTLLPWFLRYQINIKKAMKLQDPIRGYLSGFTKNTALIDLIIQHFFQATPTFFALSYFSLYLDYAYPLGGMGTLAEKMKAYVEAHEGEIYLGSAVTKVDVKNHVVTLSGGEVLHYKKLIWAADQRALYESIQGVSKDFVDKKKSLVLKSKGGDSVFTIFLGVEKEKRYFEERCGAHMFFTPSLLGISSVPDLPSVSEATKEALDSYLVEYLDKTTYEISCPSLRDETLAPRGKTSVVVSTLLDYDLVQRAKDLGYYEEFKENAVERVLKVLEGSMFPGIKDEIACVLSATPLTMEKETSNYQGAITGWAFTNEKMPAENRFPKIAKSINTPLEDIYQCGQWTFSPSGLPVSILTGKLAADQVKKCLKK